MINTDVALPLPDVRSELRLTTREGVNGFSASVVWDLQNSEWVSDLAVRRSQALDVARERYAGVCADFAESDRWRTVEQQRLLAEKIRVRISELHAEAERIRPEVAEAVATCRDPFIPREKLDGVLFKVQQQEKWLGQDVLPVLRESEAAALGELRGLLVAAWRETQMEQRLLEKPLLAKLVSESVELPELLIQLDSCRAVIGMTDGLILAEFGGLAE
jgi:hypothetical protein